MSQKIIIINKLREDGEVSRNWALKRFISRLGAIIWDLKQEGWRFEEGYTSDHKDYYYKVLEEGDIPKKLRVANIPSEYISAGIVNVK